MKKLILTVVVILLSISYFVADRESFWYGRSHFKFYNLLPFNGIPEFEDKYDGWSFIIRDDHGLSLLTNNVPENVIKYGYNEDALIGLIETKDGKRYFNKFLKNPDTESKRKFIGEDGISEGSVNLDNYIWIDIEDSLLYSETLTWKRNYSLLAIIIVISISAFGKRGNGKS